MKRRKRETIIISALDALLSIRLSIWPLLWVSTHSSENYSDHEGCTPGGQKSNWFKTVLGGNSLLAKLFSIRVSTGQSFFFFL